MKASELRIGNYINAEGVTGTVTTLSEDTISISNDGYASVPHDVEGIPLSEEWLIKFGFDIEWTVGGFLKWEKPVSHENKFKLLDRRLPYPQLHKSEARIEYVHQLQNLYFALTSKELTIKE